MVLKEKVQTLLVVLLWNCWLRYKLRLKSPRTVHILTFNIKEVFDLLPPRHVVVRDRVLGWVERNERHARKAQRVGTVNARTLSVLVVERIELAVDGERVRLDKVIQVQMRRWVRLVSNVGIVLTLQKECVPTLVAALSRKLLQLLDLIRQSEQRADMDDLLASCNDGWLDWLRVVRAAAVGDYGLFRLVHQH